MTAEKIEIVYPDDSFAQFGGHVIERLFQTRAEMRDLGEKRYRVRVTIETFPLGDDSPSPVGRGTKGEGLTATATPLTPALSQGEREVDANG